MQIFHPAWNTVARLSIPGALLLGGGVLTALNVGPRTDYRTGKDLIVEQPVPFSHQHHVRGLGLDCRLCHPGVEREAFAGLPATSVCMICHRQIWAEAALLAPVRRSARTGEPLSWNRVHDLPDFTYFHHGVHVQAGIGCSTCHGRVDQMPLTRQVEALHMSWCLECHRAPAPHLRARDEVFAMDWQPSPDQPALGRRRMRERGINPAFLTDCGVCHR